MVKQFATAGSLLVVLSLAAVVPAATAEVPRAEPPASCAGLVTQLADGLKKVIGAVTADPPAPGTAAGPLGDTLGLLTAMQGAKCLPPTPVSVPPADQEFQGPELCLSHAMLTFAGVYGVLGKVVQGAVPPNAGKLRTEVSGLLKTANDLLSNCALPPPPGGMPTMPPPTT